MDCSMLGLPVHHQLPELAQTRVHPVGDVILLSHPLSSPSPPAFNLSQHQGLFQQVSSSHQVAKVLEFQLQQQSSNEYSGLISFRMDWLDLFAVQGTLKSLFQHHSSKASILHSAFFMVQLSHPYMTTGKTVTLSRIRWPKRRAATCLSNWALSPVFSSVIQNYYNFICMSWCETCCEGMTSGIWKPFRGERESERQKERETHRGREREDNDARTEKITKEIKS